MFRTNAKSICELLDKAIKINGSLDCVFSENIRGYLGENDTYANTQINNTINSQFKEYFPLLNNGLTIICEEITNPEDIQVGEYVIPVKNPVIINGLQTTNVIYKNYKKSIKTVENIYLTIKLIATKDANLIDLITEATNTQTPITLRDKISKSLFNIKTRKLFESKGVNYVTKRSELYPTDYNLEKHSASSELILNIWTYTFLEKPEKYLTSGSDSLKDIYDIITNAENTFHELFNGNDSSPIYNQLFLCYMIYHEFNKSKISIKKLSDLGNKQFVQFEGLLFYGAYKILEEKIKSLNNTLIYGALIQSFKINLQNFNDQYKQNNDMSLSVY